LFAWRVSRKLWKKERRGACAVRAHDSAETRSLER
jgi:hypothetical protein